MFTTKWLRSACSIFIGCSLDVECVKEVSLFLFLCHALCNMAKHVNTVFRFWFFDSDHGNV